MSLSTLGIHELQPVPDATIRALNPQVYVVARAVNPAYFADNARKAVERWRQVRALLDPAAVCALRLWPDDKQSTSGLTPQEWLNRYGGYHQPGMLLMPDNEAESGSVAVIQRVVQWHVDLIRLASPRKIALGVGCFPTGNPLEPEYGLLRPLFAAMHQARREHGVIHWWRPNAYWNPQDAGHEQYHLQRHQRMMRQVCRDIGEVPMFQGEIGIVGLNAEGKYDAGKGYQTLGITPEAYALMLADKASRLDVPAAIFCAGAGMDDSRQWESFDVNRGDFWRLLAQHTPRRPMRVPTLPDAGGGSAPAAVPVPTDKPYTVGRVEAVPANYINLRAGPGSQYADLGDLRVGDTLEYTQWTREGFSAVRKVNGAEKAGWFAWLDGKVRIEQVDTLPEPEPPGTGIASPWLTADEIQQLAELHERIAVIYRAALARGTQQAA